MILPSSEQRRIKAVSIGIIGSPWHRLPTSPKICLNISSRVKSAGGYKSKGNSDMVVTTIPPS